MLITNVELKSLRLVKKKTMGLFGEDQSPFVAFTLFGRTIVTSVSAKTGNHAGVGRG